MIRSTQRIQIVSQSAFVAAMLLGVALGALSVPSSSTAVQDTDPMVYYGYTYQQPDGNRYVLGQGTLPESVPLDVELDGRPLWVVAARQRANASIWAVVLEDGSVQAFRVIGREVSPIAITPDRLPVGMPPLLRVEKVTKNRAAFPSPEAARKLLWLAHRDIAKKWTMPIPNWAIILNHLAIRFDMKSRLHKMLDRIGSWFQP